MSTGGYEKAVRIGATPETVFEALTTLEDLAAWWTPAVTGSPVEGGQVQFHFDDQTVTMEVTRAIPGELVEWACLGHSVVPEWGGTSLIFQLVAARGGASTLHFEHTGLVPSCHCYRACSNGWDHYLRSLTDHAEGRPGAPWGTNVPSSA